MVTLVQTNWNILVEDSYRVRGIITVLYPTNYIPSLSRTNNCESKHWQPEWNDDSDNDNKKQSATNG